MFPEPCDLYDLALLMEWTSLSNVMEVQFRVITSRCC